MPRKKGPPEENARREKMWAMSKQNNGFAGFNIPPLALCC